VALRRVRWVLRCPLRFLAEVAHPTHLIESRMTKGTRFLFTFDNRNDSVTDQIPPFTFLFNFFFTHRSGGELSRFRTMSTGTDIILLSLLSQPNARLGFSTPVRSERTICIFLHTHLCISCISFTVCRSSINTSHLCPSSWKCCVGCPISSARMKHGPIIASGHVSRRGASCTTNRFTFGQNGTKMHSVYDESAIEQRPVSHVTFSYYPWGLGT